MESLLQDFSKMYEEQIAEEMYKGDEARIVRNPILFVFIGDRSQDALLGIQKEVLDKWQNGQGMLFFQVGQKLGKNRDGVYSFQVSSPEATDKAYRQSLHRKFYDNTQGLYALNKTIGEIRNHISKFGNLYATCEKVHICMISQVDDPLNVLVQDLGVLLKRKMSDHFKQVAIDFYGLVQEQEEENYSMNCATAMSFFRELEYMQSEDFYFKEKLEVVDKDIFAEPIEEKGPLFNLNYLLSNRNEKGVLSQRYMDNNYRMIATMNILKNRQDLKGFNESNNQIYNDGRFKQELLANGNKSVYITLGLGKVQRPNQRIAFTVLLHFYNYIVEKLRKEGEENERSRGQAFGYNKLALKKMAAKLVPSGDDLDDMQGILAIHMKANQASKQTFRELEGNLYGGLAQEFFYDNFESAAMKELTAYKDSQQLDDAQAFFWTEKNADKSVLGELRSIEKLLSQDKTRLEDELDELYGSRVSLQNLRMLPFAEKTNMRNIKRLLFQTIYKQKLEILRIEVQLQLVKIYEAEAEEIYDHSIRQLDVLDEIGTSIDLAVQSYERDQDGYLEKNIEEYYKGVVDHLLLAMEKQRVETFYFDDRFMGDPYGLLDQGKEAFIKKLIQVCQEHILSDQVFKQSFEEELLNRANVTVRYGEQGTVTKEELFGKLYLTLEEASNLNIYTYRYAQKNPQEEKYYFGDYYSDLMQYIFKSGAQSEQLSVGCVYEKRTSGIEVLRIMGGFRIQDLIYIKACKKYYDLYLKEGYLFHGINPEKLPHIEFSQDR